MSKSRKVLAALLALVIAVGVFSMSAFATGNVSYAENEVDADGKPYTQDWGLSDPTPVEGKTDTYIVSIVLTTNYKVGPIQFQIGGTNGDVNVVSATVNADGYYPATASVNKTTGLVLLTPNTDDVLEGKTLDKAVIASVTYTSGSNDAPGIVKDVRSASNMDGTLVAARLTGQYLNNSDFVVGQTATFSSAGQVAPPVTPTDVTLELVDANSGVVIDENKTFGGAYAGAVYGFTTANNQFRTDAHIKAALNASDGSELVLAKSSGNTYGTGATVTVGDKTYVVIIFGDVDGNGLINVNDTGKVKAAQTSKANCPDNSVVRMAANCQIITNPKQGNMMHMVNVNDTSAVKGNYTGKALDQKALAECHYGFNVNYQ